MDIDVCEDIVSTHSRPKAAGTTSTFELSMLMFQHTAARRRLGLRSFLNPMVKKFQHTAARRRLDGYFILRALDKLFQHTAARRRLDLPQSVKAL